MAAEKLIRLMDDAQLRREAAHRRLTGSAVSVLGSMATLAAAFWLQNIGMSTLGLVLFGLLVVCNVGGVFRIFRWMSEPAKEIAKRRKRTVLRMLGSEPQSEA